ncbi:MAG: hypothetical protein V4582_05260 [Pseudomonadota bacterium]
MHQPDAYQIKHKPFFFGIENDEGRQRPQADVYASQYQQDLPRFHDFVIRVWIANENDEGKHTGDQANTDQQMNGSGADFVFHHKENGTLFFRILPVADWQFKPLASSVARMQKHLDFFQNRGV